MRWLIDHMLTGPSGSRKGLGRQARRRATGLTERHQGDRPPEEPSGRSRSAPRDESYAREPTRSGMDQLRKPSGPPSITGRFHAHSKSKRCEIQRCSPEVAAGTPAREGTPAAMTGGPRWRPSRCGRGSGRRAAGRPSREPVSPEPELFPGFEPAVEVVEDEAQQDQPEIAADHRDRGGAAERRTALRKVRR